MGIYLVDYENVHNDGVTDIQKLSASDRVVILYGDSCIFVFGNNVSFFTFITSPHCLSCQISVIVSIIFEL